ncbi:MAG: hypothetical protein P4K98_14040 [Bryobacteraceae bacterium]|nr:hypothetical protein [Bryobacteraceae bacterium]
MIEACAALPGMRCAEHYKYMCSDPGQSIIRDKIVPEKLDGVVVASCSPHMHLKTFRRAAASAGLNPYLLEMANIREQCSWVHHDVEQATAKAIDIIGLAVAKVKRNHALEPIRVPLTRSAFVIGGGVAGIQAARWRRAVILLGEPEADGVWGRRTELGERRLGSEGELRFLPELRAPDRPNRRSAGSVEGTAFASVVASCCRSSST